MLKSPYIAMVVTFAVAFLWLRINDYFAHRGWVDSALSRKIIHIGTGPIFVLCWLLFPDVPISRFLAALVPAGISVQFAAVGLGLIQDPAAVDAMSRGGDRREILKGPLFYGIVFVALTLAYWKEHPVGLIALMMLCGGDGLADVIGSRVKSAHLKWSVKKTWAGSAGMFFGGLFFSVVVLSIFVASGVFGGNAGFHFWRLAVIAAAAMLTESLPVNDVDNLTVPLVVILVGHLLY
jgi:phytol kinase